MMLIIGRAVAGVGAAAVWSGGLIIIALAVPLASRPLYIAALSSMSAVSSVVGPVLGGVLTDSIGWRWCFWINLPLGGVALLVMAASLNKIVGGDPTTSVKQRLVKIDIFGAIILTGGITALLLALQWGGIEYPWSNGRVWGCILASAGILAVFCILQSRRGDNGIIPARLLFRQRTILAASMFSCFLGMASFANVYYLPFYFQAVKGTDAETSGLRMLPYLAGDTITAIIVAGCIQTVGWYTPFMWIGSSIFVTGCGLLSSLRVQSPRSQWIAFQAVTGIGFGSCVQIPFLAVQVVSSKQDLPSSMAILTFFNFMGGAISASIAQNIFRNVLTIQLKDRAPSVNPAIIVDAGAAKLRTVVPPSSLQGVLVAYNHAVTRVFFWSIATGCVAFCVSFLMEWKSVNTQSALKEKLLRRKKSKAKVETTMKRVEDGSDRDAELARLTLPPISVDDGPWELDKLFPQLDGDG